ncbi:MAG: methenyltetrahydromethanopterin cyclohydrolase [Planctomycetales bacterium]|nr:methenyltetrahydromethanopterin cyclohydrolase [Planctomycetales bacterium]
MEQGDGLNLAAQSVFESMVQQSQQLRIQPLKLPCGARLLDCGVHVPGGVEAGLQLASICLANQAKLQIVSGPRDVWAGPWVQIASDHPRQACMMGQYAGWPVKFTDFFAMGSGPMRILRGKEELLLSLAAADSSSVAVGTLECDELPTDSVALAIAEECAVPAASLCLAVAPTRSLAGCVQVVARSVETALHKLHELGFDLGCVQSALGIAPLPPPSPDFVAGIGRTNDAILYGGHVSLWVAGADEQIASVGALIPSCNSRDFGQPFAKIFKNYNCDFYKVDPGLFSPAQVSIMNLATGRSWQFGSMRGDLLQQSFGTVVSN